MLIEQPLSASAHDRSAFTCGTPALDEYLQRFALQQSKKHVSNVYVLIDDAQPSTILGYYTLSAAQVDAAQLSDADQRKLPHYPVPCFRMGRLACALKAQGTGMGKILMGLAVERCLQARQQVASYALIVDAKDDKAAAFYLKYGFTACTSAPLTLYLPLGS